ncbi:MAG: iron-only hydrogenase system regulator [Eubacteriales bacterium]|nr:iron-only hydrogenase system regulator [Eubacteriales bacterium]
MENRIAVLCIIVDDRVASSNVNRLLNAYGEFIIGRMGIPHRDACAIITVVLDCPVDTINALSGKLGRLEHVQIKSMMAT